MIIATTALCMAVNFPDVRYIINWGPARSILDQHQEAGRAGRDGEKSHVIVLYHGQQTAHCEQEVKDFVKAKGCLRVASYQSLDSRVEPVQPSHDCCLYCATICKCSGNSCYAPVLPFEETLQADDDCTESTHQRDATPSDRNTLKDALFEILEELKCDGLSLNQSSSHGFSVELIEDVCRNCEAIFSVEDLMNSFPVFSLLNGLKVLEVVQEIFMDISNFEETLAVYNLRSYLQVKPTIDVSFDFNCLELGVDGDSDFELYELSEL